jgi:hypothetical protein
MNSRERILATAVIGVLLLAGGAFLFHQLFLVPLQARDTAIQSALEELDKKTEQVRQAVAQQAKLARWRQLSLPADVDLSLREYEKYLTSLMERSGFPAGSYTVKPRPADARNVPMLGKKPIYTRLIFNVVAHANLESVVDMLDSFYQTGLMHQIKNLNVQRPLTSNSPFAANQQEQPGSLDIDMTVEALVLAGAENRPHLLPNIDSRYVIFDVATALPGGPTGLGVLAWATGPTGPSGPGVLAQPARDYTAMAEKNIIMGSSPEERPGGVVELTRFVHLTDITKNDRHREAFLYDRYNNRWTRLRNSIGFDKFRIIDGEGEPLVEGRVVKIEDREVIFRADEKYYVWHIGNTVHDALRKSLTDSQVDEVLTRATKLKQ